VNLFLFVKDLIITQDTVVIPGFGGFVSKYRPAVVDEDELSIAPPAKDIIFDNSLVKDNGGLAAYLSNCLKITKNEALELIQLFVTETQSKLKRGERVAFEDIGYFGLDENQSLFFEQEKPISLASEVFGMQAVPINKIKEEMENDNTPMTVENPVLTPETEKKKVKFSTSKIVLASAAVLIVAAVIYASLFTGIFGSAKDYVLSAFNPVDTTQIAVNIDTSSLINEADELPADDLLTKADSLSIEAAKTETSKSVTENKKEAVKEEPKKVTTEVKVSTVQSGAFYLISGSFSTMDNAKKECQKWKQKGYSPEVLDAEGGKFRVSVSRFSDKAKANAEIKKIKADFNQSVWLLAK
jgi:nucleoid DNA-binding protein/cell division septation protein DedD